MAEGRLPHCLRTEPVYHAGERIPVRQAAADRFGIKRQLLVGAGAAGDDPAGEVEFALAAELPGILGHEVQSLLEEVADRFGRAGPLVDEAAVDAVALGTPAVLVIDGARGAGLAGIELGIEAQAAHEAAIERRNRDGVVDPRAAV